MTVISGTVITATMRGGSMYATVSIINLYKEGSLAIQQAGKTMSTKITILCKKCPYVRRGECTSSCDQLSTLSWQHWPKSLWGEQQNSNQTVTEAWPMFIWLHINISHSSATGDSDVGSFLNVSAVTATAFRFFLCDLTRLELRLHGPGGRGGPREDCPAPLCHGVQGQEPKRVERPEEQTLLSSSRSSEDRHSTTLTWGSEVDVND